MDKSSRLQVLIPNSLYRVYVGVCTLEYVRRSLLTWTHTANEDLHLTLSTVDKAF